MWQCRLTFGKEPTWYPLWFDDPDVTEGEILATIQLIPYPEADQVPVVDIKPRFKDCQIEINAVGLRGMIPFKMMAIDHPSVEFDTGDKNSRNSTRQKVSLQYFASEC